MPDVLESLQSLASGVPGTSWSFIAVLTYSLVSAISGTPNSGAEITTWLCWLNLKIGPGSLMCECPQQAGLEFKCTNPAVRHH